jgi:PTH1 family peptidyl-tRNA hydrolase
MRKQGSDGGHNGLKDIAETLGHNNYSRLRIGIGDNFGHGGQIDFVLGKWSERESKELPAIYDKAAEAIRSFGTVGVDRAMNVSNTK